MKKYTIFYLAVLVSLLSCKQPTNTSQAEEWTPLFNKKDLTGWDIKIAGHNLNDNFNNTFQIRDSALVVDYNGYQKFNKEFGHIYYHEPFSYYRVRLEYRFVGAQLVGGPDYAKLNSGIMLHSQAASSLEKEQSFPVSLEMQFLANNENEKRHTGNLCTPGTEVMMNNSLVQNHCVDSNSKNYEADRWIIAEAVVLGDSLIHHIIEGDTVLTYQQPRVGGGFVGQSMNWAIGGFSDSLRWIQKQSMLLSEGYIALQAESHPIEFRKIELLNLKGCTDTKALNYKSYFVASDNSKCRYR